MYMYPGLEVIKNISCLAQLSIKFILLINVKNAKTSLHLNIYKQKIAFYEKADFLDFVIICCVCPYNHLKVHAQLSLA